MDGAEAHNTAAHADQRETGTQEGHTGGSLARLANRKENGLLKK